MKLRGKADSIEEQPEDLPAASSLNMEASIAGTKFSTSGTRILIRTDLYAAILLENRLIKHQATVRQSPMLVFVAMLVLLVCVGSAHLFYLLHQVGELRPQEKAITERAQFTQRDLDNSRVRIGDQEAKVAKRTLLLKFAKERLSWAPVLESVMAITPAQIELTSIRGSYFGQNAGSLVISGQTATRTSRLDCDKFRLLLVQALSDAGFHATSKFNNLLEVDANPTGANFLTTQFVIQLNWGGEANGK